MITAFHISVILIVIFSSMILLMQYGFRYFYFSYGMSKKGVVIKFLRLFPILVLYENIKDIRLISTREAFNMVWVHRFGSKIWGNTILIETKKGLIRKILITPDNSQKFIDDVKGHINYQSSE